MKNFKPDKHLAAPGPTGGQPGAKRGSHARPGRTSGPITTWMPRQRLWRATPYPCPWKHPHRRAWRVLAGCFWALERPARGGIGP